jgi:uncharacterized ferritin-like protein (DUF455 family)
VSEDIRTWEPFSLCTPGERPPRTREISSREGVADRLRAAAFAEIQAREAFLWAAKRFEAEAPAGLCAAWRGLAREEDKHLGWLLARLAELGFRPDERPVSDYLWQSFMQCGSAEEFARFMASAEDRGRIAGERFFEALQVTDPVSAEIFRKIAAEEIAHIRLAERFFGASSPQPGVQV